MPRIRTIKPEFWDSPSTARASAVARLAYIGMWNWADDHGRGTANLKELEGFIFPNDDVKELSHGSSENFRAVIAEVAECFDVAFYCVNGRNYYQISHWEKHQRNERKAGSKYPSIEEADSVLDMGVSGNARKLRDTITEAPQSSGLGTGEQGNRGTGEQILLRNAIAPTQTPDAIPDAIAESDKREKHTYSHAFLQFWEQYPRKQDKLKAWEAWQKRKHGTHQQLIAGARRYAQDPNREERYTKRPASWINAAGWEDETAEPNRFQQAPMKEPSWVARDRMNAAFLETLTSQGQGAQAPAPVEGGGARPIRPIR